MRRLLIDAGISLSYYQRQEPLHGAVVAFFARTAAQLITSPICIAEVLSCWETRGIHGCWRPRTIC